MTTELTDQLKGLALVLFDAGAFLDKSRSPEGKGFRLKLHEKDPNAPLSPFYLNLRTPDNPKSGPLTPELVQAVGAAMCQVVEEAAVPYDAIAGIPRAGEPFAAAVHASVVAETLPLLHFEKIEEGGTRRIGRLILPEECRARSLLLVDDLVTGADTKREAVQSAIAEGLRAYHIVVLLDRQQGGSADLLKEGVRVWSCFTIRDLLWLYVETEKITHADYVECTTYLDAAA